MALFETNPNEKQYVGGQKHFVEVLKNRSNNDTLIYKNPEEDFNNGSTLVVGPGEQAIFVNEGNIEQVFDTGSFALTTENYPFISRLRNALSGSVSSFHCLVYFVRTATSREIKWGTESPIKVYDKAYVDQFQGVGVETEVRARGAYRIRVTDAAVFLTQLIGNNYDLADQESLREYFRNQFLGHIVAVLTRELTRWERPLIEVPANVLEYADYIQQELKPVAGDYGLDIENFSVAAIDIVDNEARQRAQELISKNREQFIGRMAQGQGEAAFAQGQQAAYQTYGTNYQQAQVLNAVNQAAANPGSDGGSMLGAGLGLTVGAGMGKVLPEMVNDAMSASGGSLQGNQNESAADSVQRLSMLKQMLEQELITSEEYEAKKKDILNQM
ncbi:membrane protein [Bombiscardovia apis]|uniref:Membrane protein n=1 Tax=Bombiscardovia apis TaxID=2932182 RepID=A0ABN6SFA9_9BIFI|nr:SPFH domain-containing protein [Bombiscardovia apis]BDR54208.1 membrane protein [Bombiscardovia apis]